MKVQFDEEIEMKNGGEAGKQYDLVSRQHHECLSEAYAKAKYPKNSHAAAYFAIGFLNEALIQAHNKLSNLGGAQMSQRSATDVASVLWEVIKTHFVYQSFKVPEDRAEILEQLAERLDEEINQLVPETNALL